MADLEIRQMTKKELAKRQAAARRRLREQQRLATPTRKVTMFERDGVTVIRQRVDGKMVEFAHNGKWLTAQGMTKRKFAREWKGSAA